MSQLSRREIQQGLLNSERFLQIHRINPNSIIPPPMILPRLRPPCSYVHDSGQNCALKALHDSIYCCLHIRIPYNTYRRFAKKSIIKNVKHFCALCDNNVDGNKVILQCGCKYHLNCFLIVQNEPNCYKCDNVINKTDDEIHDCSICLEPIKDNSFKTKCSHFFHSSCISTWRDMGSHNHDKCPNCRAHF